MKIAVYSCRPDEEAFFKKYAGQYGAELLLSKLPPDKETAFLAEGCDAVDTITTPIGRELIDIWHGLGVKTIATRTVGFEHIDWQYAKSLGISVSNVSYTPHTVAEYTVMAMLMAIRKIKTILNRYLGQTILWQIYAAGSFAGLTVGVVGTGKIGEALIRILSGFGCRILACSPTEKETVKPLARYCSFETLCRESDILTLHAPRHPGNLPHDRPEGLRLHEGRRGAHQYGEGKPGVHRRSDRRPGIRKGGGRRPRRHRGRDRDLLQRF